VIATKARYMGVFLGLLMGLALGSIPATATTTPVFASGLNNPRGLHFGPDGQLYLAEGGVGGSTMTTSAQCQQVPMPVGPYSGGFTASISRIDSAGHVVRIATGLPSDQTNAATGGLVSGVADVAFIGSNLYGIESAAGCSHGLAGTFNNIFRVNDDGSTRSIANLSAFVQANPTAHENSGDFEPDETWYSMVPAMGAFYAVGPNHGEVDRVTIGGHISRLIDVSAAAFPLGLGNPQGHIVPTAITFHDHAFYLTNLDVFDPGFQNQSRVFRVTSDGQLETVAGGLNAAVGIAFDQQGRLYVLEAFTGFFAPVPRFTVNTGMVVRLNSAGGWDTIAHGLNFPTAMTFGPDGRLYISNCGFGCPQPGAGQIVRVDVGP
jgi:hypothetical protein